MKRFYKEAGIRAHPEGYAVVLDGKPVKTPDRADLVASSESLALALAAEWSAQGDAVLPHTMRLTQILGTRIDRIPRERAAMTETVLKYLDTDLLCYRADQPPELAALQAETWDPWLAWFGKEFGGTLETTTGLKALTQSPGMRNAVIRYVEALDDDRFTVLQLVVSLGGSLVLALAFVSGDADAEEVFRAAHVEEAWKAKFYKEDFYGADPGQEKKQDAMRADLKAAENFLAFFKNNM